MPLPPLQIAVVLVVVATGGAGALFGYRHWRRRDAARRRLAQITGVAYETLRDVLVPDGNGDQLHVDFILLTAAGVLVVDLREVNGMIFGSESMDDWTVMHGTQRRTFSNPLGPLYDRIAAVKQLAGKEVDVDGRVVFAPGASFPKGRPPCVILLEALAAEFPRPDTPPADDWMDAWRRLADVVTPSPTVRRP